jgi:hypothetical protein
LGGGGIWRTESVNEDETISVAYHAVYAPGPPVILPAYDSDGNFQNGPLPNDQTAL